MLAQISKIDKVSIVALAKKIEAKEKTTTISELATKLGVPLTTESRNRSCLVDRLNAKIRADSTAARGVATAVISKIVTILLIRSAAFRDNHSRRSYAPWFKDLIAECHEHGAEYAHLSELTGIGFETMAGFRRSSRSSLEGKPIEDKAKRLLRAWTDAPAKYRDSLDTFWYYLGKKHEDFSISRQEMRQTLIDLGLRYPRGPKIADHGAQVKRPFSPHAIWEGDGKQMKIRINGREFNFSWYAFTDQNTTLLVGSDIGMTESSENFLKALKDGGQKTGLYSVGILIDNRLSDQDLSPIRKFCSQHNIALCRIFPGNSKTNGNIENNFSIFERFVGPIDVYGATAPEIAQSVAKNIVEIFTQLRNHTPRGRLRGNNPDEACRDSVRPEDKRDAIERMANRFDRENRNIEEKWQLIEPARVKFGPLLPQSELKIKKQLGKYPVTDIIAAQASYLAQIVKYPENTYGPEYFLAILRHKRETKAKQTYNEAYRAGVEQKNIVLPPNLKSARDYALAIVDELLDIMDERSPSLKMLRLEALCWWLVDYSTKNHLEELWRTIIAVSENTLTMTLRWWSEVNEYLCERLGSLLLQTPCANMSAGSAVDVNCPPLDISTHNLAQISAF